MALIMFEGFEDSVDTNWNNSPGGGFSATARNGKSASVSSNTSMTYTLGTPVTTWVCGAALRFSALINPPGIQFLNSLGVQMSLSMQPSGKLALTRSTTAGTVVALSTTVFALNSWNYVEVKMVSGGFSDTAGVMEVRINGSLEMSFSGDTLNSASGAQLTGVMLNTPASGGMFVDDMYLLDLTGPAPYNDYLGDCRIEQLLPTGAGASTQWTPSAAVANWTTVDESPPSATDYVGTATSGQRDLYVMSDLASTSGVVLAVRPSFNLAKSDTGPEPAMRAVLRGGDGTVKQQATLPAQSTTFVTRTGLIETTQPNGSAWSIADVNALQIGQETL